MGQAATKSGVVAWGSSDFGQLGLPLSVSGKKNIQPTLIEALRIVSISSVACGGRHSAAISSNGELYTWGAGKDGQLGHSEAVDCAVPKVLRSLQGKIIRNVSCGENHSAATTEDGMVYTWGKASNGRLGLGYVKEIQLQPMQVESLKGKFVNNVCCGGFHTMFLVTQPENAVYACGLGLSGRLGSGNEEEAFTPIKVKALENCIVKSIDCAFHHSACVTQNGVLYTWGGATFGKLGHGPGAPELIPKRVKGVLTSQTVVSVSLGPQHTACATINGNVYTWGQAGRLGHDPHGETDEYYPRQVSALSGLFVNRVACGSSHTSVVLDTGDVWSWGANRMLSHQDISYTGNTPCIIQSLKGKAIVEISCGESHTLALSDIQRLTDRSINASKALSTLKEVYFGRRSFIDAASYGQTKMFDGDENRDTHSLYSAFWDGSSLLQWAGPILSATHKSADEQAAQPRISETTPTVPIEGVNDIVNNTSMNDSIDMVGHDSGGGLQPHHSVTARHTTSSCQHERPMESPQDESSINEETTTGLKVTLTANVNTSTQRDSSVHHLLSLATNRNLMSFYKEMTFLTSKLRSYEQQITTLYDALCSAADKLQRRTDENAKLLAENAALREEVERYSMIVEPPLASDLKLHGGSQLVGSAASSVDMTMEGEKMVRDSV